MKSAIICLVVLALAGVSHAIIPEGPSFLRGDTNSDGEATVADASWITNYLYLSGPAPSCYDAADVNDDGVIAGEDAVLLVDFLFDDGAPPGDPFPDCGEDPTTDSLDVFS